MDRTTKLVNGRLGRMAALGPLLLALGLVARAQDPVGPVIHQGEGDPQVLEPDAQDAAQREIVELFGEVERKLRKIDALLADAGSGQTRRLAEVEASGIDELLRRSLATGRSTIEDIDRILELAAQLGGQSQSGSCSSCRNGTCDQPGHDRSGSPLDRGPQSTRREETPEEPGGEQPGDEKRPDQGGRPESPYASDDPSPENEPGAGPPPLATEEQGRPPHAGDRWGDLPVHVQDIFRTEGDRHMPARYRDWIDAYYRKLSTRADGR